MHLIERDRWPESALHVNRELGQSLRRKKYDYCVPVADHEIELFSYMARTTKIERAEMAE